MTEKKYKVIYADPPWRYDFAETKNRKIENHYPSMDIEDIKKLPIAELADDDCVLFMWATAPKLIEAIDVIKSWGFTYKTQSIWDKKMVGMGYWFRGQHEILMVATKGTPKVPSPSNRVSSVYSEKRKEHSQKPHRYYTLIERMMGNVPKIELFSRHKRDGWDCWGNEVPATTQMLITRS